MKIAVVEDEKLFADALAALLCEWCANNRHDAPEISLFASGEALIEEFSKNKPHYDIIFFDVQLGEGADGVQTATSIRALGYQNAIVFTSNHKDYKYMQKGYDIGATNYYAKPVSMSDINGCMKLLNIGKFHQFCFNGRQFAVPYAEISFFESRRNYIHIFTAKPSIQLPPYKCSITTLAKQVPESFVQVHRSFIVNVAFVSNLDGKDVHMIENNHIAVLPIGDKYLQRFLDTLRFL